MSGLSSTPAVAAHVAPLVQHPTVGTSSVPVADGFRRVPEKANGGEPDTVHENQLSADLDSSPNATNNKHGRPTVTAGIQGNGTQPKISTPDSYQFLQDYQMQLMLLQQQKLKRLLYARQEQHMLILRIEGGHEIGMPWNVKVPISIPLRFRFHAKMPQGIPDNIGDWGQLLKWACLNEYLDMIIAIHNLQMMHYREISREGAETQQQSQTGEIYASASHSPGPFGGQQSDGAPSRPPSRMGNNRTPQGKIIDLTAKHASGSYTFGFLVPHS
jgi:hypothetical protein